MKRKNKKNKIELSPEEMLERSLQRFVPMLSPDEFKLLQEEVKHPLLPSIRINPLKTAKSSVDQWQKLYNWQVKSIPFCSSGYWVDDHAGIPVSQTLEHRLGHYYIQEAASMLPPELFEFPADAPGLTLDMAASPGGKTTHLIARGNDQGLIIANDSSQGRIPALRIVLNNWGSVNTAISQFPGEKFGVWFPEIFDRVLIDAPCSMQGLRTADSHSSRPITDKESLSLAKRQTALLTSALQAVKVGGQVVYSTCTLLPEEDEGVIDAILTRFSHAVRIQEAAHLTTIAAPGIVVNGNQVYAPEVKKSLRLWPHRLGTAGFFACLLEKTSSIDLPVLPPPSRSLEKVGFQPIPDLEIIIQFFKDEFGFDLKNILDSYHLVILERNEKLFAFPKRIMEQFSDFPLESAGMILGERATEGMIPSHNWVSRFGSLFTRGTLTLSEEQCTSWLQGEDCIGISGTDERKGKVAIVCSPTGLVIGRGRVQKDRLKNLLPHRLV